MEKIDQPTLSAIVENISNIDWNWSYEGWMSVISSLGLIEKARLGVGVAYSMPNGVTIRAMTGNDGIKSASVFVDVFADLKSLTEEELEEKDLEFHDSFDTAADTIESVIGKSIYRGHANDAEDFPESDPALALAWWDIKNARLSLELENNDLESPYMLSLFIRPSADS